MRWDGSHRRFKRERAFDLHFSLIKFIAARRVDRVELGPAKCQIRNLAVRSRNDALHPSCLIAYLNPHACGHVKAPVAVTTHAVRTAIVSRIGHVQVKIALLGPE